jgi:phospholipid/cholesterol/gamma-HCH transport system substrate-binding protein
MESEARYVRVGVVTLLLIALLTAGLLWLAGRAGEKAQDRYVIYFREQSLEGLQINSDVRMQGIKVGKVVDYAIIPGEAHKVRVLLQVDARTPVMTGVKAIVSRHLVTGLAAIDLENPPFATQLLTTIPEGENYPVIPEGVSQLTKVTDTLEELSKASRETLIRLNTLLSDHNQKAFSSTLANLSSVTGNLKQSMPELQATLASAHSAADQVGGLAADTRGTLKETTAQLNKVAGEVSSTLTGARTTLEGLNQEMTGLSAQVKLTTDLSGQDIQTTAQSLRAAGDALKDTGRALTDPARVLFGPNPRNLGPGEEIKK